MIIVMDLLLRPEPWGGLAQIALLILAISLGSLVNLVLGILAARDRLGRGDTSGVGADA
jgi:hypothetical protein